MPFPAMILKWFLSRTVRQAIQLRRHVGKILSAQRDLLSAQAIEAVRKAMGAVDAACRTGDKPAIQASLSELETVANKNLKSHPFPGIRENIEVLLVAIAVAMAIRTFFLQPFKIPTGSMQPTLWGITANPDFTRPEFFATHNVREALGPDPDFKVPNFLQRFFEHWVNGTSYTRVVARADGALRDVQEKPTRFLIFDLKQSFWLENDPRPYTVWFPPDNMFRRAGLLTPYGLHPRVFKKGEDIIKMVSVSGDHLFVDRLTYNFRRPRRGEIIVFETRNVIFPDVPRDQFYIKRLVGLSEEVLQLNRHRRLVVNGTNELTASTPRFENLYSFDPKRDPPSNHYYGHSPLGLFDTDRKFQVPLNHYVVMGDNTRNSLDSRYWGGFPREDAIGKAWFVYWPISTRFGWGYR